MYVKPMLRRSGAFLADFLLISIIHTTGINFLPEFLQGVTRVRTGIGFEDGSLFYGILTAAYFFGFDLINKGNTPGKDLLKLKIVGPDGTPPGVRVSLTRTLLKLVSISALPVSMVAYFWKGRQVTLQDRIARTSVRCANREEWPL